MHLEWVEKQSDGSLSDDPKWLMQKYFVDGLGEPDTTKTAKVVGISYPRRSNYDSAQLRKAARRVRGLHQATGFGATQTIYSGWNRGAVENAAKSHAVQKSRANKAKADARERERASRHDRYLTTIRNPDEFGPVVPSPAGQYMIDCEEIETGYSDDVRDSDLTLEIHETTTPGVYQATFHFGIIEGMMMLGHDEAVLEKFCADEDHERFTDDCDSEDDGSGSEEESSDEETAVGSKRKATSTETRGGPPKRAKAAARGKPKRYFVRLKSRDTGTGEIESYAEKGTVTFGGPDLSAFTGKVDMKIGKGVIFKARKISARAPELRDSWSCYSEAAYGYARVRRW